VARHPRLHVEGGSYHAAQNGATTGAVFAAPRDFMLFEKLLAEPRTRREAELHAYCLLPDYFHLALTLRRGTLAHFMQVLTSRYARTVVAGTTGHFFRQRYRATLIDADEYLLPLTRFIHYLPVRSGLATSPKDYPHSSDRHYRQGSSSTWISTQRVQALLRASRTDYAVYMAQPPSAHDSAQFDSFPQILGSDAFQAFLPRSVRLVRPALTLERLIQDIALSLEVDVQQLSSRSRARKPALARALIGWFAVERRVATLSDVARRFNRDVSALSKGIEHHRTRQPALFNVTALRHLTPLASPRRRD
jgi:putative transposase